jgi:hypothetical protein
MIKTALRENSTLFGWYNNLDLDDGSTIPGLSDRVMAWDDRDESFSAEEDYIKSQSRYNPEYDIKGFYYRWIEPRYKPQLFDDLTRDLVNTTPAKRFAETLDPSVSQMISVIKKIEDAIINQTIKSTRIVVSEDLLNVVKKLISVEGINIKIYKISDNSDLFSIWIYNNVHDSDLDKAEQYFQNIEGSEKYKDIAEDILQTKTIIKESIEKVVDMAKELCKQYNIDDLYIIGEYARKIYQGEATPLVNEIEFVCETISNGLKIGGILANKLNVSDEYISISNNGLMFPYKSTKIIFSSSPYSSKIGDKMESKDLDIENALLREICNKDFTINMMAYNVREMKVIDFLKVKKDVDKKIVKTYFDSEFVLNLNPLIIFRALLLKSNGYSIDRSLEEEIIKNSLLLSSGRYSYEVLKFYRKYLNFFGKDIDNLFEEYGLFNTGGENAITNTEN